MNDLYDKDHWIYETAQDNKVRYLLGEKGNKMLLCIGVNPSTATPEKLDPTLRRVKKFSQLLGYDGWLMANLYPLRATDPKELPVAHTEHLNIENSREILAAICDNKICDILVAWGATIRKRWYLKLCLKYICKAISNDCQYFCLGDLTKGGDPRHPLYLPNTARLQRFDIQKYMENLC